MSHNIYPDLSLLDLTSGWQHNTSTFQDWKAILNLCLKITSFVDRFKKYSMIQYYRNKIPSVTLPNLHSSGYCILSISYLILELCKIFSSRVWPKNREIKRVHVQYHQYIWRIPSSPPMFWGKNGPNLSCKSCKG